MMIRRCLFLVFATLPIFFTTSAISAAEKRVPQDYATIQAAINASGDGDRIIVAPDTYNENVQVNKGITLISTDPNDPNIVANTVIDAGGSGSAVIFSGSESANCELRGFTITGGYKGGINCESGNITVSDCIVTNNRAYANSGKGGGISSDSLANVTVIDCDFTGNIASGYGGGIFADRGYLTVIGCEFVQNSAGEEGGAIGTDYQQVTLRNCTFRDNDATYGGAIHTSHYPATIVNCAFTLNSARLGGAVCVKELLNGDRTQRVTNCTFYDNSADDYGGAVSVRQAGNLVLTNSILWENIAFVEGPQISGGYSDDISISYCCIQGGQWDIYPNGATLNWLAGNIEVDPVLANPTAGDFHLKSTAGRWDATAETWVVDNTNSPCIDTGDPASDWTAELSPNGQRINMGAFGGTEQASKSASGSCIGDIDDSGTVDLGDLKLLAEKWLVSGLSLPENLYEDGIINFRDYAVLLNHWGCSQ
jgi:hypothetical protein